MISPLHSPLSIGIQNSTISSELVLLIPPAPSGISRKLQSLPNLLRMIRRYMIYIFPKREISSHQSEQMAASDSLIFGICNILQFSTRLKEADLYWNWLGIENSPILHFLLAFRWRLTMWLWLTQGNLIIIQKASHSSDAIEQPQRLCECCGLGSSISSAHVHGGRR